MSIAATNPPTISDCVANVSQLCAIMNIDETASIWKKPNISSINFSENNRPDFSGNNRPDFSSNGPPKTALEKQEIYQKWLAEATCFNCGQKGHIRTKCPEPRRQNNGPGYSGKARESQ